MVALYPSAHPVEYDPAVTATIFPYLSRFLILGSGSDDGMGALVGSYPESFELVQPIVTCDRGSWFLVVVVKMLMQLRGI